MAEPTPRQKLLVEMAQAASVGNLDRFADELLTLRNGREAWHKLGFEEGIATALDALIAFERKERGIPQAHITAKLVAELRSLLMAAPDARGVDLPAGGKPCK